MLHIKPSVYIVVVAALVAFIDPFGAASSTAQHSRDLFNRVLAPCALHACSGRDGGARDGGDDTTRATSGRKDVLIVLFDDDFAESPGIGWPIPYVEHAWILRSIEALEPASIFIDFVFKERPEDAAEYANLQRTITSIEAGGVPVFLGAPLPNAGKTYEELGEGVRTTPTGDGRRQGQRARLLPVQSNAATGFYELRIRPTEQRPGGDLWTSPALRLFIEGGRRGRPAPPTCPDDPGIEPERGLDAFERPMWLRWPVSVPDVWDDYLGIGPCSLVQPTAPEKLGESIRAVLTTLIGGGGIARLFDSEDSTQRCPPIATLTATQLRELGNPKTRLDPAIRSFLANRHVIVGGDFTSVPDFVVSPVHGHVPGAYYHGMALANLLSYGDRYYRDDIKILKEWNIGTSLLMEILSIFILSIIYLYFSGISAKNRRHFPRFIYWLTSFIIVVAIFYPILEMLDLAPIDFVGISVVGGVVAVGRSARAEAERAVTPPASGGGNASGQAGGRCPPDTQGGASPGDAAPPGDPANRLELADTGRNPSSTARSP